MSIRNYDRHNMESLRHDTVKPFDRLKMPPWFLYLFVFSLVASVATKYMNDKNLNFEALKRKNYLLAMKE